MGRLFDDLNEEGYLEGLEIDKDAILSEMGLYQVQGDHSFLYHDIYGSNAEQCYETATKAVRYQEYVGEFLARTQKRNKASAVELEEALNRAISANKGGKVTESKALAKGSPEYTEIAKRIAALTAWEDYLDRFIDVLEKYHYLAKKKLDEIYQTQRKTL